MGVTGRSNSGRASEARRLIWGESCGWILLLPASGHGGARDHGSGTGRLLEAGVSEGRGRSSAFNGLGKHGHVSDPSRKLKVLVMQSCLTLLPPLDCSLQGFSVCGILQARIPFSRGSSDPRTEPGSPTLQADSLPFEPPPGRRR